MGFFNMGNLLTLGIMLLSFILYHQINRRNRSMKKLQEYAKRLKDDFTAWVDQKEGAVRDFGVSLDVQRKSAKELLKRLTLTNDEMTSRADAVAKLDERLKAYDASLGQLDMMADRVMENLNRLKTEGPFVEHAAKRVGAAEEKLKGLEQEIAGMQRRFEQENAQALERAGREFLTPLRASLGEIAENVETLGRKAGEHRAAVDSAERYRESMLAKDLEVISRSLKTAMEEAGSRADKLEESTLIKLRDQAVERLHRFQDTVEDKLKHYQDTAKSRVAEIQGLLRAIKDEWRTENAEQEAKQHVLRDEWKKDAAELKNLARDLRDEWKQAAEAEQAAISQAGREADACLERNREMLEEAGQKLRDFEAQSAKALAAIEAQFPVAAERAESQLEAAMSQAGREAEACLERNRAALEEAEQKLRDFEAQSAKMLAAMEEQFLAAAEEARTKALEGADERLEEYQAAQAEQFRRLESLADDTAQLDEELRRYVEETKSRVRQDFERFEEDAASRRETIEGTFAVQLEALKTEFADLKEEIDGLKGQAHQNMSEKLRLFEDELTKDLAARAEDAGRRLEEWQERLDKRLTEAAEETKGKVQSDLDRFKTESGDQLTGISEAVKEAVRGADAYRSELFSKTEAQAQELDAAIKDAERRIKDFSGQTKLFERADTLKQELERRLETLQNDIGRLNQHRAEAADLEAQFINIKRLEDDVNAKMTRFLSEKRRIELMENDFNRLIQTSKAVEDKLAQVNASDDTLQAMQVHIRNLSDALADTEDQYQRIEKKNQALETTNLGIDRNFKALQEAEVNLKRFTDNLDRLSREQDSLQVAVERLNGESSKAQSAADKLSSLADELPVIEKRIQEIQVAREWLARTETRLKDLDKDIQDRLKLVNSVMKSEGGKVPVKGAPAQSTRESAVKLARQGWKVDEIASALKLSKSEVELILEIAPKNSML